MCVSRKFVASILLKSSSVPNFGLTAASDQLVTQCTSVLCEMLLLYYLRLGYEGYFMVGFRQGRKLPAALHLAAVLVLGSSCNMCNASDALVSMA